MFKAIAASTASAMPVPAAPAPAPVQQDIAKAGYFCGPGFHLGPYGHRCVPNHGPRYWRPRCPRGYHPGPSGRRCWPN